MSDELSLYFPRIFPPDDNFQFFAAVKQQLEINAALALGDIDPEIAQARLAQLDTYFLGLNRPMNLRPGDPENAIVSLEMQFATLAALLDNNGSTNSGDSTVFDFYARLNYYMQQQKPASD